MNRTLGPHIANDLYDALFGPWPSGNFGIGIDMFEYAEGLSPTRRCPRIGSCRLGIYAIPPNRGPTFAAKLRKVQKTVTKTISDRGEG